MIDMEQVLRAAEEAWERQKTGEARARTARAMATAVGVSDPLALTSEALRRGVSRLQKHGNGPATINRKLSAYRQALLPFLGRRSVEELEWPWLREPRGRTYVLSEEDEARMRARLGAPWVHLFVFLVQTGARLQEALDLEWGDIEGDFILLRDTKNGSDRKVPLRREVVAALEARDPLIHREEWLPTFGPFRGLDPRHFRLEFKAAARACGITDPECTPHALRHTFATRALRGGVPLPVVQMWMGHSDAKTTARYLHPNDEDLLKAARRLDG